MTAERNGLRMKNEMTMKEKRFSFLPTRRKEKRKADPHLAHCLLPRHISQPFGKSQRANLADLLNTVDNFLIFFFINKKSNCTFDKFSQDKKHQFENNR